MLVKLCTNTQHKRAYQYSATISFYINTRVQNY